MKQNYLTGLLLAAMFTSGIAYAEPTTQDVPATLSISGTVNSAKEHCEVVLSHDFLVLDSSVSQLIPQGGDATDPHLVSIFIKDVGKGSTCAETAAAGHISVKFIGDADDADGTTLANSSYVTENGAKGVGIGIFKEDKTPLAINSDTMTVTDGTTGNTVFGMQMVQLKNQEVTPGNIYAHLTVEIERL